MLILSLSLALPTFFDNNNNSCNAVCTTQRLLNETMKFITTPAFGKVTRFSCHTVFLFAERLVARSCCTNHILCFYCGSWFVYVVSSADM